MLIHVSFFSGDNDESIHNKSPNREACADHPDQYYMMACQQCQLPVCVQCMESSEHKDHDLNDLGASLRKRIAEVYKNIQQGIRSQNQLWLEKKRLALEVKEIQSRMTAKYNALKQLLEEVFQQHLNDIEGFQESQSDIIGKKINDTDQYISLLMKNFKDISESLPAKALIQLKSCSLKKDLFQSSETNNLKFDENDTKLSDINDLFGILNIPKITRSESGIELDKIDDSELVDEVSNVEEVKDMELAIIEVPSGVSNFEYTGQQQIKLTLATSFSLSRTASHVSPVSSNRAWVSDFYGDLYLSDDIGYKHYQLKTLSGGSGSHTVTKEGELIFINPDKEIMKISQDFKKEDLNIRLPYSMIPSCVYSSHFNADLLIGMWSKISGMGTWQRISETTMEESYPIQYDEDKLLYEYPQYITENNNQDVIVCDSSKGALVVTDFWGNLRFCYKGHPEKLGFEPNGICTDSWAHILVCDLASNSVQVIDKNGHFLFPLLISSYGFERPFCLNLTQDTLWVGIQSYPLMLVFDVQYDDQK